MNTPTEEQLNDPKWWDENAPEGATHYCPAIASWVFGKEGGTADYCCIPRPTKPEPQAWDGEGLPPVGCECRMTLGFAEHDCIKITYMGAGVFCYLNMRTEMEYTGSLRDATFRPIRTQAERERDELASLCRAKFNQHTSSSNSHLWNQVADAIIAAGWRKGE